MPCPRPEPAVQGTGGPRARRLCPAGIRSPPPPEQLFFSDRVIPAGQQFDPVPHRPQPDLPALGRRPRELRNRLAMTRDDNRLAGLHGPDQLGEPVLASAIETSMAETCMASNYGYSNGLARSCDPARLREFLAAMPAARRHEAGCSQPIPAYQAGAGSSCHSLRPPRGILLW